MKNIAPFLPIVLSTIATGPLFCMQSNNQKRPYIEYTKVTENPRIEFRFKSPSPKTTLPQYAQDRMMMIMKHINPTIKITYS